MLRYSLLATLHRIVPAVTVGVPASIITTSVFFADRGRQSRRQQLFLGQGGEGMGTQVSHPLTSALPPTCGVCNLAMQAEIVALRRMGRPHIRGPRGVS